MQLITFLLLVLLLGVSRGQSPLTFPFPRPPADCKAATDAAISLPIPRHVVVIRHAEFLAESNKTLSGPSLSPLGFARSFALPFWYAKELAPTVGWPQHVVALPASVDNGSPINSTYSMRELLTVAPLVTYLEALNGTQGSNNIDVLISDFSASSEAEATVSAICLLFSTDAFADETILVSYDHRYIPVLLGGLTQQNATSWGTVADDDFDKVFLLSYGNDSATVDTFYQAEPSVPDAWGMYVAAIKALDPSSSAAVRGALWSPWMAALGAGLALLLFD